MLVLTINISQSIKNIYLIVFINDQALKAGEIAPTRLANPHDLLTLQRLGLEI